MAETELSEKLKKIAQEIENLSLVEMAQLTKYLEEKFGVSGIPMVTATTNSQTKDDQSEKSQEKTTFTVVLTDVGTNKLAVIKAVREILPNLGLIDAKKLVESAPKELLTDVKKEMAEEAKKKIETAGGKVELK